MVCTFRLTAMSPKSKRYSSDRSERMRELQAEGRVGAKFGKLGGRPRKVKTDAPPRPAAAAIAAAAAENAPQMAAVLIDVLLDDNASRTDKLRAIKLGIGIETGETQREDDERDDPANAERVNLASREDLIAGLSKSLSNPIVRQRLAGLLAGSVPSAPDPAQDA